MYTVNIKHVSLVLPEIPKLPKRPRAGVSTYGPRARFGPPRTNFWPATFFLAKNSTKPEDTSMRFL